MLLHNCSECGRHYNSDHDREDGRCPRCVLNRAACNYCGEDLTTMNALFDEAGLDYPAEAKTLTAKVLWLISEYRALRGVTQGRGDPFSAPGSWFRPPEG